MQLRTYIITLLIVVGCLSGASVVETVEASGEACTTSYPTSDYIRSYTPIWNGLSSYNQQISGTHLMTKGAFMAVYKDFEFNTSYSPTRFYATTSIISASSSVAFSTIFNNFGEGVYFAVSNEYFLNICGDNSQGTGHTYFHIDGSGNVTFLNILTDIPESPESPLCDTCTRIISVQPSGTIASSTVILARVIHYLNDDDYDVGSTYIEYKYTPLFGDNREVIQTFTFPIVSGYGTSSALATGFLETGTYSVLVTMYTDPWYWFRKDLTLMNTNVYVNASSSIEDILGRQKGILDDIYGGIICEFSFTSFGTEAFDCLLDYIWASVVPPEEVLKPLVTKHKNDLLSRPPFGYVTRLSEIFTATSTGSSTSLGFVVSFPDGTPGENISFNANFSTGLHNAIIGINAIDVETIEGGAFDKFLFYWNTIWWILFAFWLLKEIIGFNALHTNKQSQEALTEQKI